jgi:hypothetical protein
VNVCELGERQIGRALHPSTGGGRGQLGGGGGGVALQWQLEEGEEDC